MNKVYINGASATQFGELWEVSPRDLARQAVENALGDAGISTDKVGALFVGNMLSGILGGQEHLGAFFAEELGIKGFACKIEGACASGGLAVHEAVSAVLSGKHQTVLVLGIEKMTDHKPDDVAKALMGAGSDAERVSGATFPGLYAMLAHSHMNAYKTTEKHMAAVSVKNHFHAKLNTKAQFQKDITIEQVLKSTPVADPLKLLDCSPISDGAAAIVVSSVSNKQNKVCVVASEVATDTLGLAQRKSLTELRATKKADDAAFLSSFVKRKDIDVAEVHDCFSIAEILAMEDMGFYTKGTAAEGIVRGETRLDREVRGSVPIVNTSGGLKACGHPVGATGVKQVVEVYDQLVGRCGKRQVKQAEIGLTHNVGGSGATAVVHILRADINR